MRYQGVEQRWRGLGQDFWLRLSPRPSPPSSLCCDLMLRSVSPSRILTSDPPRAMMHEEKDRPDNSLGKRTAAHFLHECIWQKRFMYIPTMSYISVRIASVSIRAEWAGREWYCQSKREYRHSHHGWWYTQGPSVASFHPRPARDQA
jgi:hypothetical protein